jgi:4a-hydroxytetrahydrobiopterin dehydratase
LRLRSNKIRQELVKVQSWKLSGMQIQRAFDFEDFNEAMRFVNRVARLAESMNHHPDILIQYNKVKLSLTTHDEGGLTVKDFRLARKINRIVK